MIIILSREGELTTAVRTRQQVLQFQIFGKRDEKLFFPFKEINTSSIIRYAESYKDTLCCGFLNDRSCGNHLVNNR